TYVGSEATVVPQRQVADMLVIPQGGCRNGRECNHYYAISGGRLYGMQSARAVNPVCRFLPPPFLSHREPPLSDTASARVRADRKDERWLSLALAGHVQDDELQVSGRCLLRPLTL